MAAALMLFLAASSPHRVHHFFDGYQITGTAAAMPAGTAFVSTPGHNSSIEPGSKRHEGHSHHNADGSIHVAAEPCKHAAQPHGESYEVSTVSQSSNAGPHSDGPQQDRSAQPKCFIQVAAQHAHLFVSIATAVTATETHIQKPASYKDLWQLLFNPAPFCQRAPPEA
jgi:hypothetical protein